MDTSEKEGICDRTAIKINKKNLIFLLIVQPTLRVFYKFITRATASEQKRGWLCRCCY